jgi:hypothetical protein
MAKKLGRPVRLTSTDPDGTWELAVHPDGHVDELAAHASPWPVTPFPAAVSAGTDERPLARGHVPRVTARMAARGAVLCALVLVIASVAIVATGGGPAKVVKPSVPAVPPAPAVMPAAPPPDREGPAAVAVPREQQAAVRLALERERRAQAALTNRLPDRVRGRRAAAARRAAADRRVAAGRRAAARRAAADRRVAARRRALARRTALRQRRAAAARRRARRQAPPPPPAAAPATQPAAPPAPPPPPRPACGDFDLC